MLVSGCSAVGSGDYCDLAKPILFNSEKTIDWLARNDGQMLTDVVIHNEQVDWLCYK